MSVAIRFRRGGRRNRPFFRIVVADSRSPRDGKFIEAIGHYDPLPEPEVVEVKTERLVYWLLKGANPSVSLKSMLNHRGIWKDVVRAVEENRKESKTEAKVSFDTEITTESQPEVEVETVDEQGGYDD